MGFMKRFVEQVSVEQGTGGEITGAAIREADKRLKDPKKDPKKTN